MCALSGLKAAFGELKHSGTAVSFRKQNMYKASVPILPFHSLLYCTLLSSERNRNRKKIPPVGETCL